MSRTRMETILLEEVETQQREIERLRADLVEADCQADHWRRVSLGLLALLAVLVLGGWLA